MRVTTSRGQRGSRVSAVAEVSRANSAYASSTMTMPGAAAQTAPITSGASAVPVGLFGEVRKTRSGWCSRIAARAGPGSSPKPASRAPLTQRVPVASAISGCIEYEGSKPSAVRPCPPNAWNSCWMTSLEPFAAHTWPGPSPWPR